VARSRSKVILITGARSGIGRACAEALVAQGHRVHGTSRTPTAKDSDTLGFPLLAMDVDDTDSVHAGVDSILEAAGHLDVVVNNAGFGYGGAVEDTSLAEAKALFETNFNGVLRVCRAVLPHMRARRHGLIVNVSSIGGVMGLPFQGLYSASKFALEGLSASLRMEVKPFDIHVVVLEPGDIRTSFTANRRTVRAAVNETLGPSAYRERYAAALSRIEADEQGGPSPDVVARTLTRIVNSRVPRPRYVVGPFYERVAAWASRALPAELFEWLLMKYYGV
jgi:NAD(P)-dependent dehydrogenase (short-subunit alcohol dehydrogenase family)